MTKTKVQGELPLAPAAHRGEGVAARNAARVVTIGHSNRPLDAFLDLLRRHDVRVLADVRAFPRSRHNPQFNGDTLPAALAALGIGYRHYPDLGGRRSGRAGSLNTAWREPAFRAFADHMATPAFVDALAGLAALGARERVCLMCAEAQPSHCHRSLIADALTACGVAVEHILDGAARRPHALPAFARIEGTDVTYPAVLTE